MKDLLMIGFIITAPLSTQAGEAQEAYTKAAQAFYNQSGLENMVNEYVEREVPEPMKKVAGNTFLLVQTIKTQQVRYTWSF